MQARFQNKKYEVVLTEHAKLQMSLRNISEAEVLEVIETEEAKAKEMENRFWVFKTLKGRDDNMVSLSISIESPRLIVITTMINWSPK